MSSIHDLAPGEAMLVDWTDRTMHTAHAYLIEHWASVETGQVVDVEFILGETEAPKTPEGEAGPDVAF